jgi:hypothetical protein
MRRMVPWTALILTPPMLLLFLGPERGGGAEVYRRAVTWGLPIAAALLAALARPRMLLVPRGLFADHRLWRLIPICLIAAVVQYAAIGVGHAAGWLTFTYGAQSLMEHPARALAWAAPLCLLLGVAGWERALRGVLLAGWGERIARPAAVAISCVAGLVYAAPAILRGPAGHVSPYVLTAFVAAACREISCSLLFLSGGGLLLAGVYRGALYCFDVILLNDWSSLYFPLANYVTSDARFYAASAAGSIAAALVIAAGARRAARRGERPVVIAVGEASTGDAS